MQPIGKTTNATDRLHCNVATESSKSSCNTKPHTTLQPKTNAGESPSFTFASYRMIPSSYSSNGFQKCNVNAPSDQIFFLSFPVEIFTSTNRAFSVRWRCAATIAKNLWPCTSSTTAPVWPGFAHQVAMTRDTTRPTFYRDTCRWIP